MGTDNVKGLPHCDDLFMKFFDRWYSEEDRKRKIHRATRPDMLRLSDLAGKSAQELVVLNDKCRMAVEKQLQMMLDASRGDWATYLPVSGDVDLSWIRAFDQYYTAERVLAVIEKSNPEKFGNEYIVLCCEFGAAIGHVMRILMPRLQWLPEYPYWESSVFDGKSGSIVPVFHWAIKKMSSYGIDDGFAAKTEACLAVLDNKAPKRGS